ncbi:MULTISPECIES: hypothetical protein [Thermomonosporaceae]|uniref:hypothetical protein n=1 Tax=Thermomonosporaceae TaxID=2012 RepID=UPI00255B1105|nr:MULTISPECIES: hypothetical protein [Thermomonosporaceae]MDL4772871.1 hypothetical protein [Actinomadura xylanilytica]
MGQQIQINPERIAQHGEDVKSTIASILNGARDALNTGGTIEGGDFSVDGTMASMAYPMALQFAYEDLETHLEMLSKFASGLDATARTYRAAEEASTITQV